MPMWSLGNTLCNCFGFLQFTVLYQHIQILLIGVCVHSCVNPGTDVPEEEIYEIWSSEEDAYELTDESIPLPLGSENFESPSSQSIALSKWILHFLMLVQAKFKLSDVVLSLFLKFFIVFLSILGKFSKPPADIAKLLPSSLYSAKLLENQVQYLRYVVCKKCHTLYHFRDCFEGAVPRSKSCSFIRFPNHPQLRMRLLCGSLLLKTVELAGGRTQFYPFMTYCYLGVDVHLQMLLNRSDFFSNCELWRKRKEEAGILSDVYDGQVWKDFQNFNNEPFLSEPGNYALMLNLDFFQPYKYIQYSLGAIYMTVLNLPRGIRNKQENVMLVGLIPGPHEPKHDLNSFLGPCVNDLLKLWDGVELNISSIQCRKKIRCALLCVSCDLPAGRKVCGFLGHNARLGCSRCLKEFSGSVGSMDYSGFARDTFVARSGTEHRALFLGTLNAHTQTERDRLESTSGCRYSVLSCLPYFDAPRMLVVDPMHNLFLGSAKHYVKSVFVKNNILSDDDFSIIQKRIDSFLVPVDVGRIPYKISTGFASFTADQWKNWTVYFSMIVLRDHLSTDIYNCWQCFVLACRFLSSKIISVEQLKLGDALLMQFCRRTETLFGATCITPNMHMHCHLRACIEDYGPVHGFWLYAFERYNGIMGSMPNNNRAIEVQLMRRFLRESLILSAELPAEFSEDFVPFIPSPTDSGSVFDTLCAGSAPQGTSDDYWTCDSSFHSIVIPSYSCRLTFSAAQKDNLIELYSNLYYTSRSSIEISAICMRYTHISIYGKHLGAHNSRMSSSSVVMVTWNNEFFGVSDSCVVRAARINYFCKHATVINGYHKSHLLVNLSWFKYHPKNVAFGKPVTVWYHDLFEPCGIHSMIPIQFIKSRSVSLIDKLDGESVLFVTPLIDF